MAQKAFTEDYLTAVKRVGSLSMVVTDWVDQQTILRHPSIMCCVTHAGWNTVSECIVAGVPMIVWPLARSDQPVNAALVSGRDKPLALELFQVSLSLCATGSWWLLTDGMPCARCPLPVRRHRSVSTKPKNHPIVSPRCTSPATSTTSDRR